jgi:hypothetical protein
MIIDSRQHLIKWLGLLVGQSVPDENDKKIPETAIKLLGDNKGGLGYSQLNELLLLLGFDRISHNFFQYLVDESTEYKPKSSLGSFKALEDGITRFRKAALLLYGNVKFAFKKLSHDKNALKRLDTLKPANEDKFTSRHNPVCPIEPIKGDDTYYLGHIIGKEIDDKAEKNPDDQKARNEQDRKDEIIAIGKRNHEAYLASDHLDVYVATSMRARHEFLSVSETTKTIFEHEKVAPLKLRWFDPTQAYCLGRIDKGLSEALMLKRAKCTVYFAQEADTLGKDSELASTLAQGKPVIAFIPEIDEEYIDNLLNRLKKIDQEKNEQDIILDQIKVFAPETAWDKKYEVCSWLSDSKTFDLVRAKKLLKEKLSCQYDKRAKTLCNDHPLGIQVNLNTGVANGVLVVRTIDHCVELIKRIVTNTMEFRIEEADKENSYTALIEVISGCTYRVMTHDHMLTNTFWNFYLDTPDTPER